MFTRSTLMQGRITHTLVLLALGATPIMTGGVEVALAQCEAAKFTLPDPTDDDEFGEAVSHDGEWLVVGTWRHANHSGAAYVYHFDGLRWVEEAKLTAPEGTWQGWFGDSVAVGGGYIAIGAPGYDETAYVFRYDTPTWVQDAELIPSDATAWQSFGNSIAISGDRIIVGAGRDDHLCPGDDFCNSGAAYVFRREGTVWVEEAKLRASDAARDDLFGNAVAISGSVVVVGALFDDDAGTSSGSAYVFRRDGTAWIEEAKLTAFDAAEYDHFGDSVGISGNLVVVGSPDDDHVVSDAGSAYLFRHDGVQWIQEGKLTASDAAEYDGFGSSVAANGDLVVVGAPDEDHAGWRTGAVYLFRYDGASWAEESKVTGSDSDGDDRFGSAVSITADHILVGAPGDEPPGGYNDNEDTGSAYVFQLTPVPDCNDNDKADACDIYQGTSRDCNTNYVPDECELCGGVGGIPCGEGQFCKFCTGECDIPDNTGACTTFPETCTDDWAPVCGCDSVMYTNECMADQAGASLAFVGPCSIDCCLPSGPCTVTTPPSCVEQEGAQVPACLGDNDGDGVDDACECPASSPSSPDTLPLPGNPINQKVRYLSFSSGDPGRVQAVRVTFNDLPPPYDTWNGTKMFIAEPEVFCESAGKKRPPCPYHLPSGGENIGATLQCEPHFMDWSTLGVVHVFHEGIIPSATYTVQVIDSTCAMLESNFSDTLIMTTSRWGDLVRNCATCPCGPPDGVVNIPTDVTALLDKFRNLEPPGFACYAPAKVRADHDWETPNQLVDISDVTCCLDAFRGVPYPPPSFTPPGPPPCSP